LAVPTAAARLALGARTPVAGARLAPWLAGGVTALVGAVVVGVLTGPAGLPMAASLVEILDRLAPFAGLDSGLTTAQATILWEIRVPRVVLGATVGWLLGGAGATYQGVFRNPLADPFTLGAAAGAGLGATLAFVYGPTTTSWPIDPLPLAAFAGAIGAVAVAYLLGTSVEQGRSAATIVLAGVAVAAFFTAVQTYVQQQNTDTVQRVYAWLLGRMSTATWDDVRLVAPYLVVCSIGLLLVRRMLDVLRVGELEAAALGLDVGRARLGAVALATLATAAAVSVTGLIGFVGIIVPHTVRLLCGASYRRVLPLSMLLGGAFLVLADVVARTLASPAEIPIGVVTAFFGAPFFLLVLRSRRRA
jgi:iron complex transport system permease protein